MRKLQAAGLLSVLAATLALGACGSSDETPPLDDTAAEAIGGSLAAQLAGVPASFTATTLTDGGVGGGFFPARAMPTALWAAGVGGNPSIRACNPAVDDATDTDQDGVPDNATITFTQANCTTGLNYIIGTIGITDPGTAVGYTGTFTNLLVYLGLGGSDFFSVELDGSHGVTGTPTVATLSENLVTTLNGQSGQGTIGGTLSNNWQIQFTAAQGETIVMDDVLPDGSFAVNGTFTYDVNDERFSFTVQTTTALAFDSGCTQAHPFSAGEFRAHVSGQGGNVYIKVTYLGCGVEPSVELFGRNS